MTRLALLAPALLLLGGCVTINRTAATAPASCGSGGELADYVGRPATARLGEELMQASGARTLQWIGPDEMVTMDFRGDRLRVRLDGQNKVVSARCG